jgi:hypothetical protein
MTSSRHLMWPWWTYRRWWLCWYPSAAGGYYCVVLGWRFLIKPDGRVGGPRWQR